MDQFGQYLEDVADQDKIAKLKSIFDFVERNFPELERVFKWNTPMYTHHNTFILGISYAKAHISVAPENITMEKFKDEIEAAGYSQTKGLFRIKWADEIDFSLIERIIQFNIEDKEACDTFWRK